MGGIVDHTTPAQPQPLGRWLPNFTGIVTDRNDRDLTLHVVLATIYATLQACFVADFQAVFQDDQNWSSGMT